MTILEGGMPSSRNAKSPKNREYINIGISTEIICYLVKASVAQECEL